MAFIPRCWSGVLLGLALVNYACAQSKVPSTPNVVVITIDTLRADHLGCYGYKQIKTPIIDTLAREGVRFERAFTPVPITLPSHTVIFTGTYPTLNGMHDFSGNRLGSEPPTLAAILKEHGYTTGAVVGSAVLDSRFGLNRGFDFYYDHFDFNRLQESNLDEMERPANVVANQTLEWLSKNYQKHFFLWMHLYDPHFPYQPPEPFKDEYKAHPYDGEIAFADSQVGRLISFLKEKGLYQRTLIVLSGDHGEGLGEHGEQTHGFFIYNSTLHVPLIMHVPWAGAAKEVSTLVSLADVTPTILSALNITVPRQAQGRSLWLLVRDKEASESRSLYSETFLPRLHFNWSELRGLEMEKYHFIDAPKPELYDITADPHELRNLFSQKKAVSEQMKAKLDATIREYTPGTELAEKTALDPALMERLKSLGYAGFSGGGNKKTRSSDLADPKDRIQTYELISEGMADSQHGRYAESVEKLTLALKDDPESVPIHYLLGLDYYRLQDYPKAIASYERVLRSSPDYALAVFQLGLSYARAGDTQRAIQSLQRALQLDPTNFSAAYNLGAVYVQQQRVPEATAAFKQSIKIAPEYLRGHIALGEALLYQGQVEEAISELRKAVELAPENPQTHMALAKALQAKGLSAEAQQEARKAQELDPR
jgi:arylsulfatase A-like enzyme/cytochrome c-type biogenesis protein CcmH/NrfG